MKYFFNIFLFFFILPIFSVNAELRIEITNGINLAQKIAVVPFKLFGITKISQEIDKIINNDLRNSGKFNPIESVKLLQLSGLTSGLMKESLSTLGASLIVIGGVQQTIDGNFLINYKLIDITKNSDTVLLQNQFKVTKDLLRYVAHSISDEIFKKLTGIRGAFCTKIAYVIVSKNKQYLYRLCISDYDGYNQFTVYSSLEPIMSPVWSSDGKKLAYVTFDRGGSAIIIQNILNRNIYKIISFRCHNGAPAFSPDGTKIAFALSKTGSLNLYFMDLHNGYIKQITNNRSNNTEPSWMPDNKTIVYTSDQTGRPQVYKININNGNTERISWEGIQNQNANVSSDGSFLVMVNSNSNYQHIVKQDLVTNNVEFLTKTFLDETPSIAPNGSMIIYSSSDKEGAKLYLVSTNGRFSSHISVAGRQVKFPSWSPYL